MIINRAKPRRSPGELAPVETLARRVDTIECEKRSVLLFSKKSGVVVSDRTACSLVQKEMVQEMKVAPEIEIIRKKKTLVYFSSLGAACLIILGIVNVYLAKHLIAVFDFSIAVILFLNLMTLVRWNKVECAGSIILAVLMAFYFFLFTDGGIRNTGIIWLFTYPIAAFFVTGKRRGLTWVSIFFLGIALLYALSKIELIDLTHGDNFLFIFFFAFLLITAFVYSYENIRTESENNVLAQNKKLDELNRELDFLSNHDSLTGIYNRRFMMSSLKDEFNRIGRYGGCCSILLIDIDNFKHINDARGHQAGDMILIMATEIMRECYLRNVDIVGRYGGDEFLIILPNTDKDGSRIVGEKLCDTIRNALFIDQMTQERIPVSLSIGISTMEKGKDHNRALFEADTALYTSKKGGRDRATVFTPDMPYDDELCAPLGQCV